MTGDALSGIRVTVAHARRIGTRGVLCAPGIRTWCARYGVDLRAFLDHGLPVEQFEAIDDDFARRLARLAREEAGNGR